jgi:ATP:corrinoid adenosyltransferase
VFFNIAHAANTALTMTDKINIPLNINSITIDLVIAYLLKRPANLHVPICQQTYRNEQPYFKYQQFIHQ